MAFTDADLQSAVAKLAADFSDAELEAVTSYLSEADDEVAGFGWDPASERKGYLLQRIEAHPGFKPLRLGYSDAGRVTYGIVATDEGETI